MSLIIKNESIYDLTKINRTELIEKFKQKLTGRVSAAYFFGSFARNELHKSSDLDLILIVEKPLENFVERGKAFLDLWDIYPGIDLLVYTPTEFSQKNLEETQGFWPQIKKELLQFI
jgi:predicted nucleotidyltransferase